MNLARPSLMTSPALAMVAASTLLTSACGQASPVGVEQEADELVCSIPAEAILSGQRKDGIPALTNPEMARVGQAGTEYLQGTDRVIGIVLDGKPIAIPLNIMWWHEIVNLDGSESSVAVTHCPLTGSSLAFDRGPVGNTPFGVSGLLFQTNLIMYDRDGDPDSLWPQMLRGARCGPRSGTQLPMVPIIEVTWEGWQRLHPDTEVVTDNTEYERNYQLYPYGRYDQVDSRQLLFPLQAAIDGRRQPKERVLGIPDGTGGVVFPFEALDALGEVAVVDGSTSAGDFVVLWERQSGGAMAFRPELDGVPVTLQVVDGRIVDAETGSQWRLDGAALGGPLTGRRLEPVADAFVAFWFAWPAFYPALELWSGR